MHAVKLYHGLSSRCCALGADTCPPGLDFTVAINNGKSCYRKKRRGRPPTTRASTQIGERWHDAERAALDTWITSIDETLTRGQGRLVELGLKKGTKA
jgi:hypothetical protein